MGVDIDGLDPLAVDHDLTPPGVGDNGNWAPIAVKTIANIPQSGAIDTFCNWVPVVGKHTCLKVYASQQFGEISGGNNSAQENVFEFQAAGASPTVMAHWIRIHWASFDPGSLQPTAA